MERFALKIAAKRQVTIPVRLLQLLNINEGDVLEITVKEHSGTALARGLKLVPSSLFTPKILEELRKREEEVDSNSSIEVEDMEQLTSKLLKR